MTLFRIEVREACAKLVKQGWVDAIRHLDSDERIYTFGIISGTPTREMPRRECANRRRSNSICGT